MGTLLGPHAMFWLMKCPYFSTPLYVAETTAVSACRNDILLWHGHTIILEIIKTFSLMIPGWWYVAWCIIHASPSLDKRWDCTSPGSPGWTRATELAPPSPSSMNCYRESNWCHKCMHEIVVLYTYYIMQCENAAAFPLRMIVQLEFHSLITWLSTRITE